jgi:hypothetical protein
MTRRAYSAVGRRPAPDGRVDLGARTSPERRSPQSRPPPCPDRNIGENAASGPRLCSKFPVLARTRMPARCGPGSCRATLMASTSRPHRTNGPRPTIGPRHMTGRHAGRARAGRTPRGRHRAARPPGRRAQPHPRKRRTRGRRTQSTRANAARADAERGHRPCRAAIKGFRIDQGRMHVVLRSNRVHSPLIGAPGAARRRHGRAAAPGKGLARIGLPLSPTCGQPAGPGFLDRRKRPKHPAPQAAKRPRAASGHAPRATRHKRRKRPARGRPPARAGARPASAASRRRMRGGRT